ncbi:NADH-dependent flavin oxidoreductase [Peribacillus saganii]|uniref:NADH-dependent flavin oxidoreductase n=1 Tax=Peribacillus saganii TaxID=2303992 RepID=A0A372LLA7_9BACI|nr:NADH-dependent flavin oxidoreductase [Peribacillus saganii]RFU67594.1 NADH-dependent flavin oxidoreductase [Peribacillus saganii]
MNEKYRPLFEPLSFRSGVELSNRLVMAPLTNYSSNEDGTVSDAELRYYSRRSTGVGMVLTACINVTENGQGFPGEFAGYSDDFIPSLQRLANAIKEQGAKAVLQIFHAGRMAPPDLVSDIVSASAVPDPDTIPVTPRALEESEVEEIIKAFGETTRRAIEAGFDGVEIHGANTYLIQQFFSGFTNRREDRWGGSFEKRLAFPLAVVEEVQNTVKQYADHPFLVGYRLSPEEEYPEGITMDDTLGLIDALTAKELDYLHISQQDFWTKPHRGGELDRTRIEQIYDRTKGKTELIGIGSLYTADQVLAAKNTGIPLVALGRGIIIEPDWVEKLKEGKEDEIYTTLLPTAERKQELEIPNPLWNMITTIPGWFPLEK